METSRYAYELRRELIARYPAPRGSERLLVIHRAAGALEHRMFSDICDYLGQGDVLVINDTRVIRSRLRGRRETGGATEIFLLREAAPLVWRCLVRPSRRVRPGARILFEDGSWARVEDRDKDGFLVRLSDAAVIDRVGSVPLPPYIDREPEEADAEAYQTVYARYPGSVAAPTAGLHFSAEMLERIGSLGVEIVPVTLHVGIGTFRPMGTKRVEDHRMHEEDFVVSEESARALNAALEQGRRVVAVGTTTVRVLEHLMHTCGMIVPGPGTTDLFITEGFRFRIVGGLLTNFHLPCSTLLVLVCAFAGYEITMEAYRQAMEKRYRFFSYGDAMLIV